MKTLDVKDRAQWRLWLEKNGAAAQEIFLVYYKKSSGKPRINYDDAVGEALCFGWIDGRVNKLDPDRFVQRFTPRKPNSRWSAINIARAEKLIGEGKMTLAGLAVFRPERKIEAHPTKLPSALQRQLEANKQAWKNFQLFPRRSISA